MDVIDAWHSLLRPDVERGRRYWEEFAGSMRSRKLTFGDRVHCPFLRPFFLTAEDEGRIRVAGEASAAVGERVARVAMESPRLFQALGITAAEEPLIRIEPGYAIASTAS